MSVQKSQRLTQEVTASLGAHKDVTGIHQQVSPQLKAARRREFIRRNAIAYLFLLPAIILFFVFSIYPIIYSFITSFQYTNLISTPQWVGLRNFQYALRDTLFLTTWKNCFFFLLWGIPGFILPIVLAIIINELRWLWGDVFRFIYYVPGILPPIVIYLLWQWLYQPDKYGLLNSILYSLHFPLLRFLDDPSTVIPSIVLIGVWSGTGGGMLFYLAALQGLSSHLYDAAEIDGAGILARFWYITLPQMRVLIMYQLLFFVMGAFQTFEAPFVLTGGGPMNASVTPVLEVYQYGLVLHDFGAANALSLIIFAVLLVLSILYIRVGSRVTGLGRF